MFILRSYQNGIRAPLGRREDRSESFRGENRGGGAGGTRAGCKRLVADDNGQAEKLADSKGNGNHSSRGSGSECDGVILFGTTREIESPTRKSPHIETPVEFFTASQPMGLLLIKPEQLMPFYTGADMQSGRAAALLH
jgi:hypothetical protein